MDAEPFGLLMWPCKENKMNTALDQNPANYPGASKSLWAAVGALSVLVIALAASLVYVKTRPAEPLTAMVPAATPAAQGSVIVPPQEETADKRGESTVSHRIPAKQAAPVKDKTVSKTHAPVAAPVRSTQPVPEREAAQAAESMVPRSVAPAAPAKPVCINCGTVTAVTAVQREGEGSGLGVVAGGVLGALVGNQIGGGSGKTAATVLGAVGGGWAGNTVEKKMKKETVYQIQLRMEDGRTRMIEQMTPVAVGEKVAIEGNALRLPDGSLSTPVPVKPAAPAPVPAPSTY